MVSAIDEFGTAEEFKTIEDSHELLIGLYCKVATRMQQYGSIVDQQKKHWQRYTKRVDGCIAALSTKLMGTNGHARENAATSSIAHTNHDLQQLATREMTGCPSAQSLTETDERLLLSHSATLDLDPVSLMRLVTQMC